MEAQSFNYSKNHRNITIREGRGLVPKPISFPVPGTKNRFPSPVPECLLDISLHPVLWIEINSGPRSQSDS